MLTNILCELDNCLSVNAMDNLNFFIRKHIFILCIIFRWTPQTTDTIVHDLKQLYEGIVQKFVFSDFELKLIENFVDQVVFLAEHGGLKKQSVDEAPLRKKLVFICLLLQFPCPDQQSMV